MSGQYVGADRRYIGVSAQGHRRVEFRGDDFEASLRATLAARRQTIQKRSPYHRATRAQCHGFQYVLPRPDSPVEPHLDRMERIAGIEDAFQDQRPFPELPYLGDVRPGHALNRPLERAVAGRGFKRQKPIERRNAKTRNTRIEQ